MGLCVCAVLAGCGAGVPESQPLVPSLPSRPPPEAPVDTPQDEVVMLLGWNAGPIFIVGMNETHLYVVTSGEIDVDDDGVVVRIEKATATAEVFVDGSRERAGTLSDTHLYWSISHDAIFKTGLEDGFTERLLDIPDLAPNTMFAHGTDLYFGAVPSVWRTRDGTPIERIVHYEPAHWASGIVVDWTHVYFLSREHLWTSRRGGYVGAHICGTEGASMVQDDRFIYGSRGVRVAKDGGEHFELMGRSLFDREDDHHPSVQLEGQWVYLHAELRQGDQFVRVRKVGGLFEPAAVGHFPGVDAFVLDPEHIYFTQEISGLFRLARLTRTIR